MLKLDLQCILRCYGCGERLGQQEIGVRYNDNASTCHNNHQGIVTAMMSQEFFVSLPAPQHPLP